MVSAQDSALLRAAESHQERHVNKEHGGATVPDSLTSPTINSLPKCIALRLQNAAQRLY